MRLPNLGNLMAGISLRSLPSPPAVKPENAFAADGSIRSPWHNACVLCVGL